MERGQGSEIDWTIEAYQCGRVGSEVVLPICPFGEMVKRYVRLYP